jgi:hypothetical protein
LAGEREALARETPLIAQRRDAAVRELEAYERRLAATAL